MKNPLLACGLPLRIYRNTKAANLIQNERHCVWDATKFGVKRFGEHLVLRWVWWINKFCR